MADLHFTEYATRVAAYALIVRDEQVLLSWYNGQGRGTPCWSLPGGGVDYDEDLVTAAAREAMEETGYEVAIGRPLTTSVFIGDGPDGRPWKSVRVVFEAEVTGGELGTIEVGGTTDHAAWLRLDQVEHELAVADVVVQALQAHATLTSRP